MPYISQKCRAALDADSTDRIARVPFTPGELNYKITQMLVRYLDKDPTYDRYNAVVGALECAKLEMYRRMVAPYEEIKKAANGDVYPHERRRKGDH